MASSIATGLRIGEQNFSRERLDLALENVYKLANHMNFHIEQLNGQRYFGPSYSWKGDIPGKACEVFIGNIPRDIFEDQLVPIFSSIGPLYQFRLMMDFGGDNRGFAFAMYTKPAHAQKAILCLNNLQMNEKKRVAVISSNNNNSLYLGGIKRTPAFIMRKICQCTPGVLEVIVTHADYLGRRFVFVEYEDHNSAAMGRRYFMGRNYLLWESKRQIIVDWRTRHHLPQPINVIGKLNHVTGELEVTYARTLNFNGLL